MVFLLVLSIVSYGSISSLNESYEWVQHTNRVLGRADSITAAAVDMETGMRGFLLAGKEGFLDPHADGDAAFNDLTAVQD